MGTSAKKGGDSKKGLFTSSAFLASTTLALLVVAALIVVARLDNSRFNFFTPVEHTFIPTVTPPTSQATSAPTIMSTTTGVFVSGISMGSPDAPVTIVVYSDFQCAFCQQFALTTEGQLKKAYIDTGKVRLVYKHFIFWGDESELAAEASEAAAAQNKFWVFHDLLMQARPSEKVPDLTIDKLNVIARQADLDMAAFDFDLSSGRYKVKVFADTEEGKALGVTNTPTFFINGNKGVGSHPFDVFQKFIDGLLTGGGK